eukprot:971193-Pleurochrysis_carterae.AAC.1
MDALVRARDMSTIHAQTGNASSLAPAIAPTEGECLNLRLSPPGVIDAAHDQRSTPSATPAGN